MKFVRWTEYTRCEVSVFFSVLLNCCDNSEKVWQFTSFVTIFSLLLIRFVFFVIHCPTFHTKIRNVSSKHTNQVVNQCDAWNIYKYLKRVLFRRKKDKHFQKNKIEPWIRIRIRMRIRCELKKKKKYNKFFLIVIINRKVRYIKANRCVLLVHLTSSGHE